MGLLGIPGGAGENTPTITPAGADATPVTQQAGSSASAKPSIFHCKDEDKDSTITTEEMGIDKILKSIKQSFDKLSACGDAEKEAKRLMDNILSGLDSDISYKETDSYDDISTKIANRQADAESLLEIAKLFDEKKTDEAYKKFGLTEFTTLNKQDKHNTTALEKQQENENDKKLEAARAEVKAEIARLVNEVKANPGKDLTVADVKFEKTPGLEFKEIRIVNVAQKDDNLKNDRRAEVLPDVYNVTNSTSVGEKGSDKPNSYKVYGSDATVYEMVFTVYGVEYTEKIDLPHKPGETKQTVAVPSNFKIEKDQNMQIQY